MNKISAAATLFVLAVGATPWAGGFAADSVSGARSVPGTVVPSTGTTGGARALEPAPWLRPVPPANTSKTAGSLSGTRSIGTDSAACTALRRTYAQSQACFAPFRLANGGLRPEAFRRCKQIENPSVKCGSAVVD